jgi:hypothetical protein
MKWHPMREPTPAGKGRSVIIVARFWPDGSCSWARTPWSGEDAEPATHWAFLPSPGNENATPD